MVTTSLAMANRRLPNPPSKVLCGPPVVTVPCPLMQASMGGASTTKGLTPGVARPAAPTSGKGGCRGEKPPPAEPPPPTERNAGSLRVHRRLPQRPPPEGARAWCGPCYMPGTGMPKHPAGPCRATQPYETPTRPESMFSLHHRWACARRVAHRDVEAIVGTAFGRGIWLCWPLGRSVLQEQESHKNMS